MDIKNQLFLGDCREILKNFPGKSISACITDPPYNYEFIGHKWDAEEINRRVERVKNSKTLVKNIPYGSGLAGGVRNKRWYERVRQNILDYENWCYDWATEVFRVCKPGAPVVVFNSTRTMAHVQVALERAGFYARDYIVYRRSGGIPKGMNLRAKLKQRGYDNHEDWNGWHSCLRNEWEGIVVVQKPLENNYLNTFLEYGVGLFYTANSDGSFQSNIIENIPKDREQFNGAHCTVKPLALMEKLVEIFSPPSSEHIILDPFAGTGTTLLAAKGLGRSYAGIEIEPDYIEIIENRLVISKPQGEKSIRKNGAALSASLQTRLPFG
ncbi:MAG TPA: site-specific DNA-methyltransferase [Chloroflexi bacterium]|nr:MAG: DNA methyltransferase [Anaerolineaceae bacterium 4572_5.2]HEY84436.1 site-specific DNA-methyltransferase [Chloroflexota bacterium]